MTKKNEEEVIKENEIVLKALPVLQKIMNTETLAEYFNEALSSFYETQESRWEKEALEQAIASEVARLYGKEKAEEVFQQLQSKPIVETGTHLAFMRDYDNVARDELRARLNQNILISSAMMKHIGAKYHIGVYGSNVSLTHSCSGGYYQLGDEILPIEKNKIVQSSCLYKAPSMSEDYFNESILLWVKLKMLKDLIEIKERNVTDELEKSFLNNTLNILQNLVNYGAKKEKNKPSLIDQFNKTKNKERILSALEYFNAECKRVFGKSFKEIDEEYKEYAQIFGRKELDLADQTALVQSNTINKALSETGIEHINVDCVEVCRKFLIQALETKNSLWHKIFDNPEIFDQFHQSFVGIRSAWKEGESPFNLVQRSKDKSYFKNVPLPLAAGSHDVESIKNALKNKEIIPSSALVVLIFQSAGILAHGGFFQTTYASKIKKQLSKFLRTINQTERAKMVDGMSVDIAFLSLAVAYDSTGKPMKLSEFTQKPTEARKRVIDAIPNYPSRKAVIKALTTLREYLNKTAPGYLEAEAEYNNKHNVEHTQQPTKRVEPKVQPRTVFTRTSVVKITRNKDSKSQPRYIVARSNKKLVSLMREQIIERIRK